MHSRRGAGVLALARREGREGDMQVAPRDAGLLQRLPQIHGPDYMGRSYVKRDLHGATTAWVRAVYAMTA